MNRLGSKVIGIGLVGVAGVAMVLPTQSRGDVVSALAEAGVPEGAEIVAWQADANGRMLTVIYRDADGTRHTIGGIERLETPAPD